MAVLASWSGLGLADGAAVGTSTAGPGDTAFTTVTSGAFTVDDSGLHAPRLQVDQQAATEAQLIWDSTVVGTSLTAWAARVYVELSGYPPSNGGRILSAYTAANTLMWFVDLTTTGVFRLRDSGGSAVDTDGPLPLDTELRVEAVHDDGDVTVTVYTGDGDTPVASVSSTGLGTGSGLEAVRFGMPATSPTWPTFWLDELAVADTSDEIGPVPPPPIPTPPPPRFPLQDRYELLLDGDWVDVTEYVYDRDAVTITRGRSAEAQEADPAQMTLTLDNRDGRFSPRNPTSPYYGILGRNTQIRASLPYGSSYLRVRSGDGSHATCPDAAALDITGDLDVRVDVDADQWHAGDLAAKYELDGDQRSWYFGVEDGRLRLSWSPDGTIASRLTVLSTAMLPRARGRMAVRVALDVDDGSSGHVVTFYTADTIAGPWTQLGDPVTGTGTTSVHGGTAGLEVGGVDDLDLAGSVFGVSAVEGRYLAFELRDGIDGTLVASPDFTAQTAGATSFDDAQGNTWTITAQGAIDDRRYRFHGEVASWPATWRMGGHDAYVQITASGVKRRLTQNAPLLGSPMFRQFTYGVDHVVAYWPMEDAEEATQVAAAHSGVPPMTIVGAPEMAGYQDWTASDPVPVAETGAFVGSVPAYAPTGQISVRMFVYVTELPGAESSLLRVDTTGSARSWDVRLTSAGSLRTRCFDPEGTSLLDSSAAFNMHMRGFCFVRLELTQTGSNVAWRTVVADFNNRDTIHDSIPTVFDGGTVTSRTLGIASRVSVNRDRSLGKTVVGHVVVADDVASQQVAFGGIAAYNGEDPIVRIRRLCREEAVAFSVAAGGWGTSGVTMGDQLNKPLTDLLEEAAATDGGVLVEPRDFLGFAYRARTSMYNQAPAVTLDCGDRQITRDLTPVDDDRHTLNDLTVKREGGSSVHVEETAGPLSTAEPPDGVGRYSGEVTVSLERDDQLLNQAGWRLHLGTVDEARIPTLTLNLRSTGITDELYNTILGLDVGDRLVLTGLPEGLPREDMSMLVQGYTESMRLMQHEIEITLAPESPWHVAAVDIAGYDRLDTAASALAADATATDTSLSVATTGALWTTDAGDLPMDVMIAGERVTVTAISGSSSPQTFTVQRSRNGVVKAQQAGAAVSIAEPVYIAL